MNLDRREGPRLKLSKPVLATTDDYGALILDLAIVGRWSNTTGL